MYILITVIYIINYIIIIYIFLLYRLPLILYICLFGILSKTMLKKKMPTYKLLWLCGFSNYLNEQSIKLKLSPWKLQENPMKPLLSFFV